MIENVISFGSFKMLTRERVLLENGVRVPLGSRPFDILMALVERRGTFLSNEELSQLVWPDTTVAEVSLRVSLSALRKALHDDRTKPRFIMNVSGRGYSFIAAVEGDGDVLSPQEEITKLTSPQPLRTVSLIGRDAVIGEISQRLNETRLLTIVGPGGVGKTSVATALANLVARAYSDGVYFADFATISDPRLLSTTLATALQFTSPSRDSLSPILNYIAGRELLLVLDNCEHLISDIANLAQTMLASAPLVRLIATSRESLRISGEQVFTLPPLDVPPENEAEISGLLGYTAVELFVERIGASFSAILLGDDSILSIAQMCRELDGVPLAIELAAARVQEFGVSGVAARLVNKLELLTRGARTAAPRHRTLADMMEWSFSLLSEAERSVIAKLSVFAGSFSIRSALRIARNDGWSSSQTEDVIGSLVLKSLLNFEIVHGVEHYRLLQTTREYAKLVSEGADGEWSPKQALAEDCLDLVQRAEREWSDGVNQRWRDLFGRRIDDVRNSLDWALSHEQSMELGVEIAAHSTVLFTVLGLTHEFGKRVEQALAACSETPGKSRIAEMRLMGALGNIYYQSKGPLNDDDALAAFVGFFNVAMRLKEYDFAMQALSAWSAVYLIRGEYQQAVDLAQRFDEIPKGRDHQVKSRTLSHSLHYLGDIQASQRHIDRTFQMTRRGVGPNETGVQYDQRGVTLRALHAKGLWMRGFADQGLKETLDCVEDASASGHAISLCITYSTSACLLAFLCGGRQAAEPLISDFWRTADRFSLPFYREWAETYDAFMTASAARYSTLAAARVGVRDQLRQNMIMLESCAVLGEDYAEPWVVDKVLDGLGGWCRPEVRRIKAEIMLRQGNPPEHVRPILDQALLEANNAGALAWELRIAMSIAKMLGRKGEVAQAQETLLATYEKFTEGFETLDLVAARTLLRALGEEQTAMGFPNVSHISLGVL